MPDFDHLDLFTTWSDAASADTVEARPYLEDYKAEPAALLADFLDALGIRDDPAFVLPHSQSVNPQLAAEGVAALQAVNAVLPRRDADGKPLRRVLSPKIASGIAAVNQGSPIALPATLAAEIEDHFAESNRDLVHAMGSTEAWDRWLGQVPKPTTAQSRPTVTNERLAELLFSAQQAAQESFPPMLLARLTAQMGRSEGFVDWSDGATSASIDQSVS